MDSTFMNDISVEKMAAYLDNNLPPEEMAEIDAYISENEDLQALLAQADDIDDSMIDFINDPSLIENEMTGLDFDNIDIPDIPSAEEITEMHEAGDMDNDPTDMDAWNDVHDYHDHDDDNSDEAIDSDDADYSDTIDSDDLTDDTTEVSTDDMDAPFSEETDIFVPDEDSDPLHFDDTTIHGFGDFDDHHLDVAETDDFSDIF